MLYRLKKILPKTKYLTIGDKMNVFLDNISERLLASRVPGSTIEGILKNLSIDQWPGFWWGVINPWLCYFMPSPGDSKVINPLREYRLPTLGIPNKHFEFQDDSAKFWKTIREWTAGAFIQSKLVSNNIDAYSMTLIANIITKKSGEASKIKDEVISALPDQFNTILKLKPKVLICGTNDIYKAVIELLPKINAKIISSDNVDVPTKGQKAKYYKTYKNIVLIGNCKIVIGKLPQHPSRKNFIEQKHAIGYLADMSASKN
jgi:hypothetical protein